ncbi:MAG: MotA/TolQ/ExbB proton channel family protein [Dysgonamonadaceae bacterium]|jgi:biopolymer transport protein ExbB|nr:MotA/TolQ/ExbB proton channel family protein [Dysgonamonadaceae bacterium]
MKRILAVLCLFFLVTILFPGHLLSQDFIPEAGVGNVDVEVSDAGFHQILKQKFIEGSAFFMSFIALALVAGLAFCLERIIYLNLSQVNTEKLLSDIEKRLLDNDLEGAKDIARDTRGPVAAIAYQALIRIDEEMAEIERSIVAYGSVQVGLLEKNLSWISLFIAGAPSLGFLGTVIGMILAFDKIQSQGDISPSIVAGGMKVALITTVAGLIVALILQVFYNYILAKEDEIQNRMEDSSVVLMDMIIKYKHKNKQ